MIDLHTFNWVYLIKSKFEGPVALLWPYNNNLYILWG